MITTIIEILEIINKENIDYFISGGTSLYLRKIIDNTKDIDIMVKKEDKNKIKTLFKNELLFTEKKNSITFYKNGFEIEFTLITIDDLTSFNVLKNKTYDVIKKNKYEIKIVPLKELLSMYRYIYLKLGKEKHLERIKLLEKIIK
jgi:hypothetical protein